MSKVQQRMSVTFKGDQPEKTTAPDRANRKSIQFERKPGMMSGLKSRFEKLKEKIDSSDRPQRGSARESVRLSTTVGEAATANIRRASISVNPRDRAQSMSAARPNPATNRTANQERHGLLKEAIQSRATYQSLDRPLSRLLLSALDTCTGLSDGRLESIEGLLLLSTCADEIIKEPNTAKRGTSQARAESHLKLEMSILKRQCDTHIAKITVKKENDQPSAVPARPAKPAPKIVQTQAEPANTTAAVLDELDRELADLTELINQKPPNPAKQDSGAIDAPDQERERLVSKKPEGSKDTGEAGAAINEISDLDKLMSDITTEFDEPTPAKSNSAAPTNPKAPATHVNGATGGTIDDISDLDQLAREMAAEFDTPTSGKTKGAAPLINPALAEFDELDQLALDLGKSAGQSRPTAAPAAPSAAPQTSAINAPDELDELMAQLNRDLANGNQA